MLTEQGFDWLQEENRFLRGKLKALENNHRSPTGPRWHEFPVSPPERGVEAADEDAAIIGSPLCTGCARAEEALQTVRESERRWRAIFEASPDGIILTDDQMRLVEANPGAEKIFGLSRRELIGRPIANLFDTRFDRELTWACSIDAKEYSGEDSIHRPDGTTCEVEVFGRAGIEPGQHLFFLHEIRETRRPGSTFVPVFPLCDAREALI